MGSNEDAYKALGYILNIVKVLTVTNEDVNSAFLQKANDFEDCLLDACAKANKCNGIVTRNEKDFSSFGINIYRPETLLR